MATQNTSNNTDFLGTANSSSRPGQQENSANPAASQKGNMIGGLNNTLKNFGDSAAGQLNKLSTTQKVMGGLALAAGISWLSKAMNKRSA
ncbi:hypothetical protein D3Y59_15035 [Hymenobacter oligotrophus]|uniref:Uncharacterized protein n=1 Tax=Hymenobacter oligotrophus TaxID=2319843 RepID=A0A3B7QYF1_9BACT|nr:hypothetical protein [Hymenobacter oligotrophus]AYA38238.1 hypothetical protein D3Y59_15035 [Hymenobacter oligotrophus]